MFDTINVKILRFEHAEVQMRINDQNCLCLGETLPIFDQV